jgi:hypothetical protein
MWKSSSPAPAQIILSATTAITATPNHDSFG